mmetsp:Transcript_45071/g.109600  ORF Transcript_45071/g.109600 Transcript_45071/m.109600 type:complete len:282 (+) Transcript_45071:2921-3766(+)
MHWVTVEMLLSPGHLLEEECLVHRQYQEDSGLLRLLPPVVDCLELHLQHRQRSGLVQLPVQDLGHHLTIPHRHLSVLLLRVPSEHLHQLREACSAEHQHRHSASQLRHLPAPSEHQPLEACSVLLHLVLLVPNQLLRHLLHLDCLGHHNQLPLLVVDCLVVVVAGDSVRQHLHRHQDSEDLAARQVQLRQLQRDCLGRHNQLLLLELDSAVSVQHQLQRSVQHQQEEDYSVHRHQEDSVSLLRYLHLHSEPHHQVDFLAEHQHRRSVSLLQLPRRPSVLHP